MKAELDDSMQASPRKVKLLSAGPNIYQRDLKVRGWCQTKTIDDAKQKLTDNVKQKICDSGTGVFL